MAKQLIVNVNGREKKIASIEDDKVTEFYIERGEQHQGIVGNIYKGRVMRVLPGMQSAFVDIGLERDAFLYVSDFFDEEEEFERIVIDKSKKGTPDAEHAAAEEVALNRVEREQRIEAEQERAEPLQVEAPRAVEQSESTDASRRRGRRGRRRGRWERDEEPTTTAPAPAPEFDVPNTPFVAGDPSIERIIDEEETATANGEMFKDGRLRERIFDQIHAVQFNMEDDFRTAEVGSLLSSGFGSDAFERVDDGEDTAAEPIRAERRPPEEHVSSFVDDVDDDTLRRMEFQRISDDEEEPPPAVETTTASKRARKSASKKRPTKGATKTASKKRASSKKSSKKKAAASGEETASGEAYVDSEASVMEGQARGEFGTSRGGHRGRRSSKNKPRASAGPAEVETVSGDGLDDDNEQPQLLDVAEEIEVAPPPPPQPQSDFNPPPPPGRA